MTRRKARTLPSSDESPKSTRRSSRKRNDVEESPHSEETENCASKVASKSADLASPRPKRAARHASPPTNNNSTSTRRSLRRPAPTGSAEEEELVAVPPVKKLRGRVPSPNNNTLSSALVDDSDDSDNGVKDVTTNNVKGEGKYIKNSTTVNNDGNVNPSVQQQKSHNRSERTRKRRIAESFVDGGSSVTNDSENIVSDDDIECRTKTSGKSVKEETGKRRKITAAIIPKMNVEKKAEVDNGYEKGDRLAEDGISKRHGQTNGIEEETVGDWSGWSGDTSDGKKETLFNRVWKSAQNCGMKEDIQFSILSYNILAESLLKNSHYIKNISPSHWNQQHRHCLLMKELAVVDADIFCLQEVEKQYFQASFSKELSRLGYGSIFACSETPGREEGVAICFRDSLFRLIAEKSFPLARIADQLIDELNIPPDHKTAITNYVNEPQMVQCALLECRRSTKRVCVTNIHVSYAKHLKPDLRCAQIARTMWEAATFVAFHRRTDDQEQNIPLILCGDLNSTPDSPVYQLCRDGYLNDRMLNRLQQVQNINFPSSEAPVALVNVLWKAFQHPIGNIRSSYNEIYNREPPLTQNLKGNKGCLDYVWFTQSDLQVAAALSLPCDAIKELEDALPNAEFPSDHLSLAVRFSFP